MTPREIYLGCAQSYFRTRHEPAPRYRTGRRKQAMVSRYHENCRMVRHFIRKIRQIDSLVQL